MTEHIHIDDLDAPRFTPAAAEIMAGMASMVADCPLTAEAIRRRAADETGLSAFGPRDYEERLEVLLGALRSTRT